MIILAGTPIGNDADATDRLRLALAQADLIAAEDTRRLLNLVGRLGVEIHAPVVPFHDHNEAEKSADLLQAAQAGRQVLVVSDAGMPAISDPGYRLVALAREAQVPVTVIPGPSAVLTAVALAGLPTDRFTFAGFVPRKEGERQNFLQDLAGLSHTLVFFDSPRRLAQTLQDMAKILGDTRLAAVCRELTKTHEEVVRLELGQLAQWVLSQEVRGEIVIVVAGLREDAKDLTAFVPEVKELAALGLRLKSAATHVAKRENLRPNDLYRAVLQEQAE